MNLKRLANLFAITLISAATLTACGEDDVIEKDAPTIVDDPTEPSPDEGTDSSEELKVALLTDYVKDSDTFFFSNGVAINVSQGEETEGYYLFIDSLSFETGEWVEGKDLMAYCDPELRPICVTNAAGDKLFFTYADNNTFSITYTNANGKTKEHTGIQMPEPTQPAKVGTRASTDTDYLPYLGNGLTVLDTGLSLITKDWGGVLLNIDSYLITSNLDGLSSDIVSLGLSEVISKIVTMGALGYAGIILADIQAIQHAIEWRVKIEIGDITPRITAVEVEGENTVNVSINISNFVANTKSIPLYYVRYWQEVDGKRVGEIRQTGTKTITKEGDIIEPVTNLSSGTYAFQVIVYPSSFISEFIIKTYNFRSNIAQANISPLNFHISEQITRYCNSGEIGFHTTTNMRVGLEYLNEEDKIILSYCDDYGVYIQQGDQVNLYSANKTLQCNIDALFISRDKYTSLNYDNYTATTTIKMGVYIVRSGLTIYYNTKDVEIIYETNIQPKIQINRLLNGYLGWKVEGGFWIDRYEVICDEITLLQVAPFDDDFISEALNPYVTKNSNIYFNVYLTNGKKITYDQ